MGKELVEFLEENPALGALQPGTLFVPSRVSHDPANAIHRTKVAGGVVFGHPFQTAQPFALDESKLIN
jgi:hypothetical protein